MGVPKLQKKTTPSSVAESTANCGRAIILVGKSGVGKTLLCTQMPNPHFLCDSKEMGIRDLINSKQARNTIPYQRFDTYDDLLYRLREFLRREPQGPETIIVEAITGIQSIIHTHVLQNDFNGVVKEFTSWGAGVRCIETKYAPELISVFESIRNRGYHLVITGHISTDKEENVHGENYAKDFCYCNERLWSQLQPWAEAILFYTIIPDTAKEKTSGQIKSSASTNRRIFTGLNSLNDAKNRWGIDQLIVAEPSAAAAYANLCKVCRLDPKTMNFL